MTTLDHMAKALDLVSESLRKPPPAKETTMTTNTSDIKTPYDIDLKALEDAEANGDEGTWRRAWLAGAQKGYRAGVLDERARAAALVAALQCALRAATCPCCGRDNDLETNGCTADDCPGVQALAAYGKE